MSDVAGRGDDFVPISRYALIGDCHTAALVSTEGSIDWYCPGRFDGPAAFCRILDPRKGGYLRIVPVEPHSVIREYSGPTNVLETTFTTASGRVRLTDAMAVEPRRTDRRGYDVASLHRILRLIENIAGEVELELRFKSTFDYARADTRLSIVDGGVIAQAGGQLLALACPRITLEADGAGAVCGRFKPGVAERQWVVLSEANDVSEARRRLRPVDYDQELSRTRRYWDAWAGDCTFHGPHRSSVLRSALTLKMLTYEPTGALVAAPTTSLPEVIGGVRNWDYRYSWLRDASLILYSLMTVGYQEEATDFLHWLHHTHESDPDPVPQVVYTVDGGRNLQERILDTLEGYRHSLPVRVGNGAASQFQLDIFGEILTAAYLHFQGRNHTNQRRGPSRETWELLRGLVEQAAARWQEPDYGIWEVRGGPQLFLYSRLMCWAALDRGIRLAHEYGLPAPMERWHQIRSDIRHAILTRGYDSQRGAFTQAFGNPALDASALAIPQVGFLPPTDPRVASTIDRIRQDLTVDGLVYRYRDADGLPPGEGAFALCSFWLVDGLALGGHLEEAHELFERVVGYADDVGLLSEEIDPENGQLLGNFPQGFTHLALIRSAVNLAKAGKHGAEERPETEAERARRARQAAAEGYSAKSIRRRMA